MSDCTSLDSKLNTIIEGLTDIRARLSALEAKIAEIETQLNEDIQIDITNAIKQAFGVA